MLLTEKDVDISEAKQVYSKSDGSHAEAEVGQSLLLYLTVTVVVVLLGLQKQEQLAAKRF